MTLVERIADFGALHDGWDSHGAEAIDPAAIEQAKRLAGLLTFPPQAVPGSDGSISFEWHRGDDSLVLSVEPDLSFGVYAHIGGVELEV